MEYALYQAIQSFVPPPHDTNALELQKDDVLLISVHSTFSEITSDRQGWLLAYNKCKGKKGYVPVEAVKLLGSEINNTIHHPSALGVEAVDVMLETEPPNIDLHQLTECFVLSPILCTHCIDYIWGFGKVVLRCTAFWRTEARRYLTNILETITTLIDNFDILLYKPKLNMIVDTRLGRRTHVF